MTARFWVGGSGNWSDNTNHWAASSGGAPGATLPTASDSVTFDANSNATAYTVTVNTNITILDMTWGAAGDGTKPTLGDNVAFTHTLSIAGSLTLVAGMTFSSPLLNGILFTATSTGKTITTGGVSIATGGSISFSGLGGGWTLQDNFTSSAAISLQGGSLDLNGHTLSISAFSASGANTRSLTMTSATINLTANAGNPWAVTGTGFTLNASGATINLNTGTNTQTTFAGNGLTYPAVVKVAGSLTITGANTFSSLSYTSGTNKTDQLKLGANQTIAASGALTLAGNSTVNRAFVTSDTLGTQRTITVPSTASITVTSADVQDINMAQSGGAPTISAWTSVGDALGNTWGWGGTNPGDSGQPAASATQTLTVAGTINWSTAANWTSRVPLPQDDVSLGSSATATTLTADMPRLGRNIDSSSYLKTLSFASLANTIYGNIKLGASATYSGTQTINCAGRGSQTITSNGKSFPTASFTILSFGGTYALQDNFSVPNNQLNVLNGTFADGGNTVSADSFSSANGGTSNVRAISGSGTWSFTRTSATIWNVSGSGFTTSGFTGTIKLTGAITSTTFAGGGLAYPTLNWSNTASTGTLIITGANTFAALQTDNTTARTWQFPHGVPQTILPGGWGIKGKAGVPISLRSDLAGSAATLSTSSGVNSSDYLDIKDSAAGGGAQWLAGPHSVNSGNSVIWAFQKTRGALSDGQHAAFQRNLHPIEQGIAA